MREAVREGKSKNWGAQMSKTTLIPTLMAVISAFSSPANAQAPLKTNLSVKSDQPIYVITAHTVVHDDGTNSQLDNYVIVYGSEVLTVQYAESQISTVKPGASKLEQVAPGKNLHLHTRFGSWPQGPDVSQVPHIGVPIRACEMDTKYPDSDGHPMIAIQSVSSPCMSRKGDTLHYSIAPNGGIKMYEYVNFDILEATNNVGVAAAQSTAPRKDIPAIAKSANGAIVSIVMSDKDGHAIAQGSGFLISNDGVILTNYHVIAEGTSAVAKLPDGTLYVVDGVLASDKVRDVAVIKVHGSNFRTLTLGNSDQLQVGEEVVAIGNPLSLESTVSNGIVSGIRTVEKEGGKFLQVTTPISPGSSGGPLFNMAGEVVGITTMYLEGGENLNFAIPINDAKRLLSADSKVQDFPVELEKDISTKLWKHPGSTTPEKTKVWIEKDHFYESSEPWSPQNQENIAYSFSCDTVQGATLLPKLGPSGLYTGECTYTYKWIKESVTCTVKTVETITKVSPNAILGWSQHVDMSPLRHTPPTCPIAGIDGATFALEPIETGNTSSSVASPPVQPLPNEPGSAQAQTLDATKALSWISSHMLGKALHTMPGAS
ncbi:MAG: S1C family serine protease, partial [Ktedonobacteraceae bacterium]